MIQGNNSVIELNPAVYEKNRRIFDIADGSSF